MNILFFNKKQTKKFKQTAFGFVSWGAGCREVYYNLYEDNKGLRQSKLFHGRELQDIPENADFSVVAQVDGWLHGGDLPTCLFDPLDEKAATISECLPLSDNSKNATNKLETQNRELSHWNLTDRQMQMLELFCTEEFVTKVRLCDHLTSGIYARPNDESLARILYQLRQKITPHGMIIVTEPKRGYYLKAREHWQQLLTLNGKGLHTVWGCE